MKIEKTVLVEHTAAEMYQLVADIRAYPDFLPWCPKVEVLSEDPEKHEVTATVYINYLMLKQNFTTRNTYREAEEITMELVDGPFRRLSGNWRFTPLGSTGSKIDFTLDYEFANHLLSKVVGPVFHLISTTLVDAFIKEAGKKYASS